MGARAENVAACYLQGQGFKIVARNVRYKTGEIDIIAKKGKELHFIEVRSRTDTKFMSCGATITPSKQNKIRKTAQLYLNDRKNNFRGNELPPCFFTFIGLDLSGDQPQIECITDAFI